MTTFFLYYAYLVGTLIASTFPENKRVDIPERTNLRISRSSAEEIRLRDDGAQRARELAGPDLARAIESDDRDSVLELLNKGVYSSCRCICLPAGDTMTPIQFAVYNGRLTILSWLLEIPGADVNALSYNRRRTALHYAAATGQLPMILFLLESGASVDVVDSDGFTPLMNAIKANHNEIVDVLLPLSTVNVRSNGLETPLLLALRSGVEEILVPVLNESNAIINTPDIMGSSPLHVALKCGWSLDILTRIIETTNFNVNAQDGHGKTVLHRACEAGNFELAELLIKKYANPLITDRNGRKPVDFLKPDDDLFLELMLKADDIRLTQDKAALLKLSSADPEGGEFSCLPKELIHLISMKMMELSVTSEAVPTSVQRRALAVRLRRKNLKNLRKAIEEAFYEALISTGAYATMCDLLDDLEGETNAQSPDWNSEVLRAQHTALTTSNSHRRGHFIPRIFVDRILGLLDDDGNQDELWDEWQPQASQS